MMMMAMIASLSRSIMAQTTDPLDKVRSFIREKMKELGCEYYFEVLPMGEHIWPSQRGLKANPFDMQATEEGLWVTFRDMNSLKKYFIKDNTTFKLALAHEFGHIVEWKATNEQLDPISYDLEMRRIAHIPEGYERGPYDVTPFSEIRAWAQGYIFAEKLGVAQEYKDYAKKYFDYVIQYTPNRAMQVVEGCIAAAKRVLA